MILLSEDINVLPAPFCDGSRIYHFNGFPSGGPFFRVPFEKNRETHSVVRHERKFQDFEDYPEIQLGYPTVHWFVEMIRMGDAVQAKAQNIMVPILMFQAETDDYVDRAGQDEFCLKAKLWRKVYFEGAFHEILIETDAIRDKALNEMRIFIEEQLKPQ